MSASSPSLAHASSAWRCIASHPLIVHVRTRSDGTRQIAQADARYFDQFVNPNGHLMRVSLDAEPYCTFVPMEDAHR